MSLVTVSPAVLSGCVSGISSKSYLHRLLMCAALSAKATDIRFRCLSNDVQASISAVSALGAQVKPNQRPNYTRLFLYRARWYRKPSQNARIFPTSKPR